MRSTAYERKRQKIWLANVTGSVVAEMVGRWGVHPAVAKGGEKLNYFTVTYVDPGHPENGKTITRILEQKIDRSTAIRIADVFNVVLGDKQLDLSEHKTALKAELDKIIGVEFPEC